VRFRDMTHLPPEEASRRLRYLALKLWWDQYRVGFCIRDVRSDVHLKNELMAFWEGRITELRGWEDPLGQLKDAILAGVQDILSDFWDDVMRPGIQGILGDFASLWGAIQDATSSVLSLAGDIYTTATGIYTTILNQVSPWVQDIWNFVTGLPDAVIAGVQQGLAQLQDIILTNITAVGAQLAASYESLQNTLTASWNSLVEQVSGGLEAVTKGLEALPQAIAAGFNSAISYLWDLILGARTQVARLGATLGPDVVAGLHNAVQWIQDWIRDAITNLIITIFNYVAAHSKALQQGDLTAAFELLGVPLAVGAAVASLISVLGFKVVGTGIEVGEIGNYINRAMSIEQFTGAVLNPLLQTAVSGPLWQQFNKIFTPRVPEIDDAMRMYWRGVISKEELQDIIMRLGYGDKFLRGYMQLAEAIPGPSDLVRFVVRECFPLESLPEAPREFAKYMQQWGYNELWARAYWEAHWELPSFERVIEAFHRGILSEEEVKRYIVWHDYKPEPRPGIHLSDVDLMLQLTYRLPDKLDARWMLRWGVITREEFENIIKAAGYHPDWLSKIAQAEYLNMLLDERTAVKSALESLYVAGMIGAEVLRQKLREIHFLDDEINYLIQRADLRLREELVKDAIAALKTALRYEKITLEEFAAKLADLGLRDEVVQSLVAIEQARMRTPEPESPEAQVRAMGYSVVVRRFKEGLITEPELEQELRMLGYSEPRIQQIKLIARLERDYDYAMTVLSTVKSAYKRRKIGDEMFINLLRKFGFTDEKIALELSLLKLYMGLWPEEGGE